MLLTNLNRIQNKGFSYLLVNVYKRGYG